jgi:hypothetical protein
MGGGKTTFWIDPRYLFVLRYETREQGGGQSVRAEVTDVEYNPQIESRHFTFAPPGGAQQVEPPSATSSASSRGSASVGPGQAVTLPAGFLAPSYLPDGYVSVGRGASHSSGGETTSVNVRLQPADQRGEGGPYLDIEEQRRFGGLPQSLKAGIALSVGGSEGYISSSGNLTRLAFWTNNLVITLTTSHLAREELIRVAESLR